MSETAFSGPIIVFGQNPTGGEYNPDIGTSLFYAGSGILDPRTAFTYLPGEAQSAVDYGWLGFDNITTTNIVPYTASTTAIINAVTPTSATLTPTTTNSTSTGVYYNNTNFVRSDTGASDTVLALDSYLSVTASFSNGVMTVTSNSGMPIGPGMTVISTAGTVSQGTAAGSQVFNQLTTTGGSATAPVAQGYAGTYQMTGNLTATSGTVVLAYQNVQQCVANTNLQTPTVAMWNPMAFLGRAVVLTSVSGASYTTATVNGYDAYGFPMSENLTVNGSGGATNGNKAFRYIKNVVLSGGTADTTHAYSLGTRDVFGLPLRADSFAEVLVNSATSLTAVTAVTSASGFIIADRTTPSATTGDVRGTYAFTSSTGANKLVVRQSPQPYNIQSASGLFGLTQYYNF